MSSFTVSLIAFVTILGGGIVGMLLRTVVPTHHLSDHSRDMVKGAYDAQSTELTQMSANVILLDRILAHYGPETKESREILRKAVVRALDKTWSKGRSGPSQLEGTTAGGEILYDKIQGLSPKDDLQRSLQAQALSVTMNLGQTRWLMAEQEVNSASKPLVMVMVFWLTIIFIGWGLLTPPNGTVAATMFVSALSVSGAILLILEMYTPYGGWIQVSDAPLRVALAHLGH